MRMRLISARARVHVLLVMSRSVRFSITSDGPQEMLAPHAVSVSLFFAHHLPLLEVQQELCGHETARAHERWRVSSTILLQAVEGL